MNKALGYEIEAIDINIDDEFLRYCKADSIIFNGKSLVKIINSNKEEKYMEEYRK